MIEFGSDSTLAGAVLCPIDRNNIEYSLVTVGRITSAIIARGRMELLIDYVEMVADNEDDQYNLEYLGQIIRAGYNPHLVNPRNERNLIEYCFDSGYLDEVKYLLNLPGTRLRIRV